MPRPLVVFAAGGTIETAFLPYRLLNLRVEHDVDLAVALSPAALDFATPTALTAVTGADVYRENLQLDPRTRLPLHIGLAAAALLVLYPASARILAQCALGEVTCAPTRLFAFTPKDRVVVAPAIHPRMDRRLYTGHVDRLRSLGCTVLGGEELSTPWSELVRHVVDRLALRPNPAPPELVVLADLPRGAVRRGAP